MKAVVLSSGQVRFESAYPVPQAAGEVLIRVLCAGICETDLQLMRGYMGFEGVLGHEFVGIAESGRYAGQRVVGEINCSCGDCSTCRAGLPTHCPHRSVLGILARDGAFAEYVRLPEANLHPVPDSLETHEAVFVEPVAAAFQIPAQLTISSDQRVIVLGDGRLGNLCAQALRLHTADVTVIGKHSRKLAVLERMGFRTMLLAEAAPDRSADLVVDCTGSPTGITTALQFVRPRGTIVLKTTVAGEQTLSLAPLVIDEITLVGSRCGPFEPAIRALARKEIEVAPLIESIRPLEEGAEALADAGRMPTLKTLLAVAAG